MVDLEALDREQLAQHAERERAPEHRREAQDATRQWSKPIDLRRHHRVERLG